MTANYVYRNIGGCITAGASGRRSGRADPTKQRRRRLEKEVLSYRVFIPTRDSARWVGVFLDAYRRLGLEPLYIVDSRSKDETIDLLREKRADHILYTPHGDYAEAGMVEFGSRQIGAPWALRLDDDEFPSRALVARLESGVFGDAEDAWFVSRREVSLVGGRFAYSRWPTRYGLNGCFDVLNPQLRLHRVDRVRYIETLHTSGYEPPRRIGCISNECFVIHCNNILRSAEDRLEKVRKYARYDERTAWRFADECLPEVTSAAAHDFCCDGFEEFSELFDRLPVVRESPAPSLTYQEMRLLLQSTQEWLAERARLAQELHRREQEQVKGLLTSSYIFIPHLLRRPLAEFVMSLGRLVSSVRIEAFGMRLWIYYEATRAFARDYRPNTGPVSPQESFTRSKCEAGS